MYIILLGAPAAGKGTQAELLTKSYAIPHISTGDIFRGNIAQGTLLGLKANEYISRGLLVPDEITEGIVADRLRQDDCRKGFLLDGFPRTVHQAEFLDGLLKDLGVEIDAVINIDTPDHVLIERITGRRVCESCKAVYHVKAKPSRTEGVCDKCGGKLVQREDDKEETFLKRLKTYYSQTKPLLDYYEKERKLFNVDGSTDAELTASRIIRILEDVG